MMFSEIVSFCSESQTNLLNKICGWYVILFTVKVRGTYANDYRRPVNGQYRIFLHATHCGFTALWRSSHGVIKLHLLWKEVTKNLIYTYISFRSPDGSVGIETGYELDDQGVGSSSSGRVKIFHFSILSRPALGSTQPPIKWVPGALSRG
jgi:hypothetical protein